MPNEKKKKKLVAGQQTSRKHTRPSYALNAFQSFWTAQTASLIGYPTTLITASGMLKEEQRSCMNSSWQLLILYDKPIRRQNEFYFL
jgi:hypothetical protein